MPLTKSLLPSRGDSSLPPPQTEQKDQDSGYEDLEFHSFDEEDECVDSDMEGSILHRPRPKKGIKAAPALPQRSEKRTSKILENVMLELKNLEVKKEDKDIQVPAVEESDPHELYLSSEEDGSLSDDYGDCLSDLENSETAMEGRAGSSRASSRKSQEITATAISFQVVGRPQLVEIIVPNNSPQSARNRLSMNLDSLAAFSKNPFDGIEPPKRSLLRRPAPLNLRDSALRDSRRMSTASTSSHSSIAPLQAPTTSTCYIPSASSYIPLTPTRTTSTTTVSSIPAHSARKSSRLASLSALVTQTKNSFQTAAGVSATNSHPFLASDPFASPSHPYEDEPVTPKTPTSMASAAAASAWKMGKGGFQRTLSKARKSSMPKISLAYTAGVVPARNSSLINVSTPQTGNRNADSESVYSSEEIILEQKEHVEDKEVEKKNGEKKVAGPVRYEDIMKSVIRAPPPPVSLKSPTKERKGSLGMGALGMGRRKSIKGR